METEEYMGTGEVARMLGMHTNTVAKLVKKKLLPAERPGLRRLRFKRADVEAYLRGCRVGGEGGH